VVIEARSVPGAGARNSRSSWRFATFGALGFWREPPQRQGAWVALLAAALLLGLATGAGAAEEAAGRVRVVSFNLYHGGEWSGLWADDGHLEARLDLAADALRALRPDVVGLQEASVGRGRGDVAARLGARLGLHHVGVAATERVFGVRPLDWLVTRLINFREGPAILSRFPIVASEVHDLPRCRRRLDPRVLLRADVQTPQGVLSVYSTHVSRDDCQVERIAALVRERRGALPAVLTGDFNAVETSTGIAALTGDGVIDAFRRARPREDGATVWQRIEAPASTVSRRVDYVFVVPGTALTAQVLDSRVVLDEPRRWPDGRTLWPSDHHGVVADLALVPVP
jgi:endonuclease/exonuclease/phosphatase family metal-dependent hydrolase